jgi:hypothetical protein
MVSHEVRVMLAPAATFRAVLADPVRVGWLGVLKRPALFALIVGTVTAVCSTGRVTLGLVLSGTICWSFVSAVQMAVACVVIATSRHRTDVPRSLDLFFIGQGPWSVWLLAVAAWTALTPPTQPIQQAILISAAIPLAWTVVIINAFFRIVLQHSRDEAIARTCWHQGLIWLVVGAYVMVANQLWPRLVGLLGS